MIAIFTTRWNELFCQKLEAAARARLQEAGYSVKHWVVPGALEIPLAVEWALDQHPNQVEAVVACGVILKGETYHFELVANETSRALTDIALRRKIPIGHGILACYNLQQVEDRTQGSKNKGAEAALAVLEMLQLKKEIGEPK
ncbi:MAG: 6,7-dimethyl-8-ribityllumazine synthase [Bradymonadales bacterium]|nr:MAG: 6,7-dimethyl-8-ribityllumazine synthase [Bradymonadales bacterium]